MARNGEHRRPPTDGGEDRPPLPAWATHREDTAGLEPAAARAKLASVNEVHLIGRLGAVSQERALPSGDEVLTFHVVVDRGSGGRPTGRPRSGVGSGSRTGDGVDALGCAAWSARARRTVRGLDPGTWLEVEGSLRRRFRRGAAPPVSFYEVEVARVRRVR